MPNIAGRVADITGNMGKSTDKCGNFDRQLFSGSYSHCRTFDMHWRGIQLYCWDTKNPYTSFKRPGNKNGYAIYNDNIAIQ